MVEPLRLGDYLNKIYFDPEHPASFAGPRKVYQTVKKVGYTPTFSFIKQWVQDQDAYSIHKPVRYKFPRNRIVVADRDSQWDADLADMQDIKSDNDGVAYLLVVIDLFSHYAWVHPIKTKSAKDIKAAFQVILNGNRKPKQLRTDQGKEFDNHTLNKYLKDLGIKYFTTLGKANYAERLIKTIKSKIFKYLTHNNTRRYIDQLQDFVTSYNNSVHRSIGMVPSNVTKKVAKTLWWKQYKPRRPLTNKAYQFRVGNRVRISFLKTVFAREYHQRWTGELFIVTHRYRVQGIPHYNLKDYAGEEIKGSFYTEELQKVDVDPTFKVEKILKRRTRKGRKEVLVKWLRWPDQYNSWELASTAQQSL